MNGLRVLSPLLLPSCKLEVVFPLEGPHHTAIFWEDVSFFFFARFDPKQFSMGDKNVVRIPGHKALML